MIEAKASKPDFKVGRSSAKPDLKVGRNSENHQLININLALS